MSGVRRAARPPLTLWLSTYTKPTLVPTMISIFPHTSMSANVGALNMCAVNFVVAVVRSRCCCHFTSLVRKSNTTMPPDHIKKQQCQSVRARVTLVAVFVAHAYNKEHAVNVVDMAVSSAQTSWFSHA